jgi:uncharacterized protein (DUF2141 family)
VGILQILDMKNISKIKSLLFISIYFLIANFSLAQNRNDKQKTGTLTILITGIENNKGNIQVGLFNSEDSYKGEKEKYKGAVIKVKNKKVIWILKDISYGTYAIKAFHDENSDNKLNTNFIGIPTEKFGFSNNPSILMGAPSYSKTKFVFDLVNAKIEIKLK